MGSEHAQAIPDVPELDLTKSLHFSRLARLTVVPMLSFRVLQDVGWPSCNCEQRSQKALLGLRKLQQIATPNVPTCCCAIPQQPRHKRAEWPIDTGFF